MNDQVGSDILLKNNLLCQCTSFGNKKGVPRSLFSHVFKTAIGTMPVLWIYVFRCVWGKILTFFVKIRFFVSVGYKIANYWLCTCLRSISRGRAVQIGTQSAPTLKDFKYECLYELMVPSKHNGDLLLRVGTMLCAWNGANDHCSRSFFARITLSEWGPVSFCPPQFPECLKFQLGVILMK